MPTYATITGRLTIPGTEIGVRAQVTATPLTTDNVVIHPDRTDWGSATAETDSDGRLAGLQIPLNVTPLGALWKIVAKPLDNRSTLKTWTVGIYEITASTTLQALAGQGVEVTAVDVTIVQDVGALAAEAEAAAASAAASETSAAASADAATAIVIADADGAIAAAVGAPASQTSAALSAAIAEQAPDALVPALTKPSPASAVTKGLYVRTQPLGDGGVGSIMPLAIDPTHLGANGTGRIWSVGSRFAQIGYTDSDGAAFVAKASPQSVSASPIQSMTFSANYLWITTANDVWRVPKPAADGGIPGAGIVAGSAWDAAVAAASNGQTLPQATINITNGNPFPSAGTVTVHTSAGPQLVTYTGKTLGTLTGCTGGTGTLATGNSVTNAIRVFGLRNLVNGPAGAAGEGGKNSSFRNSCFAINAAETAAFACEYGTANVTYQFPTLNDGQMAQYGTRLISQSGTLSAAMVGLPITVSGATSLGQTLTVTVTKIIQASGPAIMEVNQPAGTAVGAATVTFPSTTYGPGVVLGGPSVYHCANPTAAPGSVSWAKVKTFPNAKHAHSVKVIGGLPWVGLGDLSVNFPDCGIWCATSVTSPTVWFQRSVAPTGGIPKDPINMFPITLSGQNVVLCESDSSFRDGPLLFSDATGTAARMLESTCRLPQPYTQTMRQLSVLPNGNIMWFGTSEAGAVGPTSCIWLSRAPYTVPVLLEDVGQTLDTVTMGDPIVSNGYVWFGSHRCVQEKFTDQ